MTTWRPGYRLRIYATDDVTILTPAGTAPHADKCLIASMSNVSDSNGSYKPYLEHPTGRRGKTDVLSKRTDTGEITIRIGDVRLTPGGSNALRWFQGFLGDASGREQLKGLLAQIDETRDGGATWPVWYTARVHQLQLQELQYYELTLRDTSEEMSTIDIFTNNPHSSIAYVTREQLLPAGLLAAYGPFAAGPKLAATSVVNTPGATLTLTAPAQRDLSNIFTDRLNAQLQWLYGPGSTYRPGQLYGLGSSTNPQRQLRVSVTHTSGTYSGQTSDYSMYSLQATDVRGDGHRSLVNVSISPLDDGTSLPVPANGVTCTVSIYLYAPAASDSPIYVSDVDPVQFWADQLDGKFGRLSSGGAVLRTVKRNNAAFTALLGLFPTQRYIINDVANLHDFVETSILQPLGLGYYINPAGEVVPVDMRLPASLAGLPTLTDADLGDQSLPTWITTRDTAYAWFSSSMWTERPTTYADLQRSPDQFPSVPPAGITAIEVPVVLPSIGARVLGLQSQDGSGLGMRATSDETLGARGRSTYLLSYITSVLNDLATRFAPGVYVASAPIRLASADALNVGSWVIVQLSMLPDPQTNQRGGARLMQVSEKSPGALVSMLTLLDAGVNITASAPAVGTLAQTTGDTKHSVDIPITLDAASDPVRVDGAITATSVGSAPGATDPLWHMLAAKVQAASTIAARLLPANSRLWVRARSEPSSGFQLPSAWVTPATAHIDTAALSAPSGAANVVTGTRVKVTWAVGDATLPVQLWMCTPSGGTPVFVLELAAGSAQYTFENLAPSTSYKVSVYHSDGLGGLSTSSDTTFTTSTGTRTAPGPGGIAILVGITV